MSEAALTDSTTAHASSAATLRPTSGNSTNTTSPSASWAKSVMPIVTVPSASLRTHSCEAVYLRSAGTFIESSPCGSDQRLAVAHEGILHHLHLCGAAAQIDFQRVVKGNRTRHARERDRRLQRGRKRATSDLAGPMRRLDRLVRAQHTLVEQAQANEFAQPSDRLGLFECCAADE